MADIDDLTDEELLEQLAVRMRRRSHGHTVAGVVRAASRRFGIRVRDILGPRKYAAVAFSRQVAMYVARELTGESLPQARGGLRWTASHHGAARLPADRAAASRGRADGNGRDRPDGGAEEGACDVSCGHNGGVHV